MPHANTPIRDFMSVSPHTVGRDQTVAYAQELMREHKIRHLPVLHGGELLGVISDRDVRLIGSLKGLDPTEVTVDEAVGQDPYTVAPETPLSEVVREMAQHKYGSALVMDGREVLGIFTTVDALETLARIIES